MGSLDAYLDELAHAHALVACACAYVVRLLNNLDSHLVALPYSAEIEAMASSSCRCFNSVSSSSATALSTPRVAASSFCFARSPASTRAPCSRFVDKGLTSIGINELPKGSPVCPPCLHSGLTLPKSIFARKQLKDKVRAKTGEARKLRGRHMLESLGQHVGGGGTEHRSIGQKKTAVRANANAAPVGFRPSMELTSNLAIGGAGQPAIRWIDSNHSSFVRSSWRTSLSMQRVSKSSSVKGVSQTILRGRFSMSNGRRTFIGRSLLRGRIQESAFPRPAPLKSLPRGLKWSEPLFGSTLVTKRYYLIEL